MTHHAYERLAMHLSNLTCGFSRAESGVEVSILKHLFTEEEAVLICCLRKRLSK